MRLWARETSVESAKIRDLPENFHDREAGARAALTNGMGASRGGGGEASLEAAADALARGKALAGEMVGDDAREVVSRISTSLPLDDPITGEVFENTVCC